MSRCPPEFDADPVQTFTVPPQFFDVFNSNRSQADWRTRGNIQRIRLAARIGWHQCAQPRSIANA